MLEVKDLTRYYSSKCAVSHISFSLEKGQVLGFLGINGAGKSTTMNMLTGYLEPNAGKVMIGDVSMWDNPVKAKAQIGYLPEKPPLYPDMTVWEYLDFMYSMKKIRLPKKQHMDEICERLKLTEVKHRLIRNLSKGYGQRVGIAQALLGHPPVVILDEPTVGLDPSQILEIRNLIKETKREQAVILSSHILPHIQAVCDRILIIHQGKIVLDETVKNLSEENGRSFTLEADGRANETLKLLADLPGVKEVNLQDRKENGFSSFHVSVQEEYLSHDILLKELMQKEIKVESLYWNRPNLEEIFLTLTREEGNIS